MAIFTAENRDMWNGLFAEVNKEKPAKGRTVRITRGKHTGKVGVVTLHAPSRFGNAFRYGNAAQHAMTQARGRHGFYIAVQTSAGERFTCSADLAMVCYEEG